MPLLWTAAALALLTAAPPPVIAIRNARIVPVSAPDIPAATIVLRDGLIDSISTSGDPPADARVVDGTGLTVYPGLIDALAHCGPQPPAQPAARAKGPEDRPETYAFEKAADLISPTDASVAAARGAGFTTAVCFPDRGIFSPQGVIYNLGGDKPGQMLLESPAGIAVSLRSTGFGGGYPASLMGAIAYVRQLFLDAAQYSEATRFYSANPLGNQRPENDRALDALLAAPRTLLPATDAKEIARMLRLASELKLNTVLYGLHGAWNAAALLAKQNVPALVALRWPEAPRDADPGAEPSLRTLELRDKAASTPAAFAAAGVRFALYTRGLERPGDAAAAVRKAMDSGLSQAAALRALTLAPAEIYGIANRTGSLEKGKIANLTVTRGDIFAPRTEIKYVFVDGVRFDIQESKP